MNGDVNDMLCLKETIGDVYIVEHLLLKFIIRNMQKETLGRNPSIGLSLFAIPVTIQYIIKMIDKL